MGMGMEMEMDGRRKRRMEYEKNQAIQVRIYRNHGFVSLCFFSLALPTKTRSGDNYVEEGLATHDLVAVYLYI